MAEIYKTAAGSTIEFRGEHRGIVTVAFDWFAEDACIESQEAVTFDILDEPMLYWRCDCHGDGSARLYPICEARITRAGARI